MATGEPKGTKVGFIGIGNMGLPMARNLLRAGHALNVYNRTAGRAELLAGDGVTIVGSPTEAARDAEVVVTMLADDQALRSVIFDQGVLEAKPTGAIHRGMSTIGVACSRQLAEAHAAARLWVVAAGTARSIETCRPLM